MEWIPQSVHSLSFNWLPVFLVNDIWDASPRRFSVAAGRMWNWQTNESCGINRFLLAIPGTEMQKRLLFVINSHMLRRETGESGGWRAGYVGVALMGFPPPHDTAAFSACVNKASLNCLIILCKLWDQGTYWKSASKHSAECVSGPRLQKLLFYPNILFQTDLMYSDEV